MAPVQAAGNQPRAGVFSLQGTNLNDEVMSLDGEWLFFPDQLLSPGEARNRFDQAIPIKVPGAWNELKKADGQPMGAHGFGTYIARIEGIPSHQPLSFRMIYATSNYRLFWLREQDADAPVLMETGKVGTSESSSLPQFLERLREVPLQSSGAPAWVVIQVSNYHWVHGGMFYSPELGSKPFMELSFTGRFISSLVLSGMFIMLFFYNLSIFSRQRDEKYALWLALVSLVALLSISTFFSHTFYYFVNPSVRAHQVFRYGQNAFGVLVLTVFNELFRQQYPRQAIRWMAWIMWTVTILSHIVYAVIPFGVPVIILKINQAFVLSFPFMVIFQVWRAWRAKEPHAGLSLLGFTFFFATVLNDLLSIFRISTLPLISSWGLMVMIFLQSQILAIKFAQLFQKTRSMGETLAELNLSLEHRVASQTREIRSILRHVKIGIFGLIRGKKIAKDYSQFLEIIFEDTRLEGRKGLEILLQGSELSPQEKDLIDQVLNTSLGEDELNFQFNAHLLPQTLRRQDKQAQTHQFELTWDPVLNEQNLIEMILVTVHDVSELRKLQTVAQRKAVELAMVGEILAIREEDFRRLLRNAHELLDFSSKVLVPFAQGPLAPEALRTILMHIHTLKGAARTLHLSRFSEALHGLELKYNSAEDSGSAATMQEELAQIALVLQDYETIASGKLKMDSMEVQTVRINSEALRQSFASIKALVKRLPAQDTQELGQLYGFLQEASETPLTDLLQDILQHAGMVAADVGKPAPRIILEVPPMTCNLAMEDLLRKIFVHIVRNALDHGIEASPERQRLGKSVEGQITVQGEIQGARLLLNIRDDGPGLNMQSLAAVGRSQGLQRGRDEAQIANLIIQDGVSTASKITDISGLGIGMPAVREFIQQLGGSIQVVLDEGSPITQSHRPFHLQIALPMLGFTVNPFPAHPLGVDHVA